MTGDATMIGPVNFPPDGMAHCGVCGAYLGDYVGGYLYKFGRPVTEVHTCEGPEMADQYRITKEILMAQGMTAKEAVLFIEGIKKGIKADQEGKVLSWATVKEELGL